MFTKKTHPAIDKNLEKAIDDIHAQMAVVLGDTPEYDRLTDQLSKLYKMREHNTPPQVDPNVQLKVIAHVLGIALIVGHERAHVVTSKALSFAQKLL